MLAHGAVLRKNFFSMEELLALIKDFHHAGLPPDEVALMDFAQKIIFHPGQVSAQEVEELKSFGLTDVEILNSVLAVTARSFFSKTLDALDVQPDDIYLQLEPELQKALAAGRAFPEPAVAPAIHG